MVDNWSTKPTYRGLSLSVRNPNEFDAKNLELYLEEFNCNKGGGVAVKNGGWHLSVAYDNSENNLLCSAQKDHKNLVIKNHVLF